MLVSTNDIFQRDKHYVFEDIKPSSSDLNATIQSTQEWLDTVGQAKEYATAAHNNSYSADDSLNMSESALSSHASSISQLDNLHPVTSGHRATLQKSQGGDNESLKGRKRFSKRQSKSGLTAVF